MSWLQEARKNQGPEVAIVGIVLFIIVIIVTIKSWQDCSIPPTPQPDGYKDGFKCGETLLGPSSETRIGRSVLERLAKDACNDPRLSKNGQEYSYDFVKGVISGYDHYWNVKDSQAEERRKLMAKKKPLSKPSPKAVPQESQYHEYSGEINNLFGDRIALLGKNSLGSMGFNITNRTKYIPSSYRPRGGDIVTIQYRGEECFSIKLGMRGN